MVIQRKGEARHCEAISSSIKTRWKWLCETRNEIEMNHIINKSESCIREKNHKCRVDYSEYYQDTDGNCIGSESLLVVPEPDD